MDISWVPNWGLRFTLSLDGPAALYTLLATGIGLAVLVYSSRYLPLHLEHEGRPESDGVRFYFFVLLLPWLFAFYAAAPSRLVRLCWLS